VGATDRKQLLFQHLYYYSERELRERASKIETLAARCAPTLLFFNNYHFGNVRKNARTMKKLIGNPDIREHIDRELFL